VKSVEVDLKAKTVAVAMKNGSLTRETVVKALGDTKFKVSSFALVEKKPAAKKAAKPATKSKKKS
tara:strand:+ start:6733 stop:6927 length:195 start_codon:yes stop_codon:yes gene_type:complete